MVWCLEWVKLIHNWVQYWVLEEVISFVVHKNHGNSCGFHYLREDCAASSKLVP